MVQSAAAADITILTGTTHTSPLETLTASNGPGNITIEAGATVSVAASGAAVTLNSNNDVVQAGNVTNTAASNAIGVHVFGNISGNYTLSPLPSALIDITGNGTGNYGVLLDGSGNFTGSISLQPGSAIRVLGANSFGVAINAPILINSSDPGNLTGGNLTVGSFISVTGDGATGVLVTKPIEGMMTVSGTIQVSGTQTFPIDIVDPFSGSAVAIGASIDKGLLIAGFTGVNDVTSPTASLTNNSNTPTLLIAPSVAGNVTSNITLGNLVNDPAKLDYSLINRGLIQANDSDTSVHNTAVRIGDSDVLGASSVLLNNAFYNRGTIIATSRSDNTFANAVTAVPTDATGLEIRKATLTPFTAPLQTVATAPSWTGPSDEAIHSDPTHIQLDTTHASDVAGVYKGFTATIDTGAGIETRTVVDYTVVTTDFNGLATAKTKTLILDSPLTNVPDNGNVTLTPPAGTIALTDSASDAPGAYNNLKLTVTSGNVTQTNLIGSYTVITDPSTGTPTFRLVTLAPSAGLFGNGTLTTPPAGGNPVTISGYALMNDGRINATTSGTAGGVATALLIQPGANVSTLLNNGAIEAFATTIDPSITNLSAYAINDLSGTLTQVINTRTITATASPLNSAGNISNDAVAIDLSHAPTASPESIYVLGRGSINGDVKFGDGNNTLVIEGNVSSTPAIVAGNVSAKSIATNAGTTLDIFVSQQQTGGILRTSRTQASNVTVGANGVVQFALTKSTAGGPAMIDAKNNVTFAANTSFLLSPTTFLPQTGIYTLVNSGNGTVHFDNFAAASGLASEGNPFPFLIKAQFADGAGNVLDGTSVDQSVQTVKVTIQRKSASELGLVGNSAAIFEPLTEAALNDDVFGAALLKLTSAEQVQAAVATTVPDIAGGVRALTVAMTDQATGVIGSRQRALLTAPADTRTDFHFWGQEFYNVVADNGSAVQAGFGGAGQGISIGGEWGSLQTGRYGVGFTFFSSQETERHPRDTKTNGDWNLISAYAAWKFGDFFVAPQINGGMGDFKSRRTILVSDVLGRSATAKWSSYLGAGGVTAGYIMDVGNFQIIPTIAVDAMYLSESPYNEVGGGGAGVSLKSQNQTSVRSFAGVIGQGSYRFNEGAFMPQLLAGWSHEFMNDPATIDGSFESSPGSPFHLVGPTLDTNKIVGGMSFGYVMRNWSAGFNYDASASSGALAQSATISLSSRF